MIHLAASTNRKYLPWCATTILSTIRALAGEPSTFHVIHDDQVSATDRDQLSRMAAPFQCDIDFLALPPLELAGIAPIDILGGAIICGRLLLPGILRDLDRLVYVDSDTLALASLSELASVDLRGHPVGAVANVVRSDMRWHVRDLGLDDPMSYFNSGLLVMDLELMRKLNSTDDLFACIARYGERLLWGDQDALNIVFEGAWQPLEPKWNVQNSMLYWRPWAEQVFDALELDRAIDSPALLHFEGPSLAKPWHYLSQHPYTDLYLSTLAETPWPDAAPTDRTILNRLIKPLPRERQVSALAAYERAKVAVRRRHGSTRRASARATDRSQPGSESTR